AIRTTGYTPHATDLRELSTPLPFVADPEQAKQLVGVFDTLKATTEKLGPTEDYVRLQLRLTQTEARHDNKAANTRLLEAYFYINDIKDLEIKTACTARLIA